MNTHLGTWADDDDFDAPAPRHPAANTTPIRPILTTLGLITALLLAWIAIQVV